MVSVDDGLDGVFVDAEMAEKVRLYVDGAGKWRYGGEDEFVESKQTLAWLLPDDPFLAQVGGTADHVLVDRARRRIIVRDFKYGKGVRVPASSRQLKVYLLMALVSYTPPPGGWEHLVAEVTQPRLPKEEDWVTEVVYTPEELLGFLGELYQALRDAVMPDAPLREGAWCRWCPGAQVCPILANQALAAAQSAFGASPLGEAPTALTMVPSAPVYVKDEIQAARADAAGEKAIVLPDPASEAVSAADLAKWLEGRELVEQWFTAVEQRAVRLLEAGIKIPGWVLGKRSTHRRWTDPDAAASALLKAGATADAIMKITPPTLKSPKQVEDATRGPARALVKSLTFNPPGVPALLREDAASSRERVAPPFPPLPPEA